MLVLVVLVLKTFVGGRAPVPLESETAQIAWYMNVGVAKRAKGNQCSFGQWRDRELAPSCLPCMEYGVLTVTFYKPNCMAQMTVCVPRRSPQCLSDSQGQFEKRPRSNVTTF